MSSDDTHDATVEVAPSAGHQPERKCILSGVHGDPVRLIRLALAPDGVVWPDLAAKLPGRGAWIGVDRAALETAIAKGRLKGAVARAFKAPACGHVPVPRSATSEPTVPSGGRPGHQVKSRRGPPPGQGMRPLANRFTSTGSEPSHPTWGLGAIR